jgi:hypothetical protein
VKGALRAGDTMADAAEKAERVHARQTEQGDEPPRQRRRITAAGEDGGSGDVALRGNGSAPHDRGGFYHGRGGSGSHGYGGYDSHDSYDSYGSYNSYDSYGYDDYGYDGYSGYGPGGRGRGGYQGGRGRGGYQGGRGRGGYRGGRGRGGYANNQVRFDPSGQALPRVDERAELNRLMENQVAMMGAIQDLRASVGAGANANGSNNSSNNNNNNNNADNNANNNTNRNGNPPQGSQAGRAPPAPGIIWAFSKVSTIFGGGDAKRGWGDME